MDTVYKLPLILEPQPKGGYTITCPQVPNLVTEADTLDEVQANVADAVTALIEACHDLNKPIPDWGNKDLKIGTLRHIVSILELNWQEFKD